MKSQFAFSFTVAILLISIACSTTKKSQDSELYGPTWELEYLSGPRIAFEGLYPDNKPYIKFDKKSGKVMGNNSCNGYSADFIVNGDKIEFGEPGPTTMMYCGEGETHFLNTIRTIERFTIDRDGKLNLLTDDVVMMRFKKSGL